MAKIIMKEIKKDVGLKNYTLDNLPLLKELRDQLFKAPTEVCIERAKYVTEYMKESEGEPMQLRRANAVNLYLSKRKPTFHDRNLLAGSSTSKPLGAPVYPELLGIGIWPELETISTRDPNPQLLNKEDQETLNFDIFPYWIDRTVLEVTRKEKNPAALSLMERLAFFMDGKGAVISHTTPFYEDVLSLGLKALIKKAEDAEGKLDKKGNGHDVRDKIEFFQSIVIAMKGILKYAMNLASEATKLSENAKTKEEKEHYKCLAETCSHVPAYPARTYREALNSLWICHVGVLAENVNMAMNPGRLDQVLYPYFKKDVEENNLTIEDALNLTGSIWFKIADNTNLVPAAAEKMFGGAGSVPAVTLGGIDKDNKDAVNDLTYIMLKVTELLVIKDPNVNARYHHKHNDRTYRDRVGEVIINTKAIPAMYNDEANIATLEHQGVKREDARDYAVIGCVELGSAGREYAATSSILLNLAAPMDMTLFNGKRPIITQDKQIGPKNPVEPKDIKSFDEFWSAFELQLSWLVQQAIDVNEDFGKIHQRLLPTPLLSCFFQGPWDSGKDLIFGGALYNSSGATHVGFADVVDSLNAIEYAVFEEKILTMEQMIDAIKNNFTGQYEQYLFKLKNRAPKYGTDHPIAVKNSQKLIKFLYDFYHSHTNYRGGHYRPAYWTMTNHAGHGRMSGALPSGRKAHEVFSSGITPASQETPELLPAFLAVAGLDHLNIPGGVALNMKYTPNLDEGKDSAYLKKFGDMIEAYFKAGGMQVQFNIQPYEVLMAAKKNPENYPELTVRVSGYSAYFKDLNEAMMDEMITRSQYNLLNGKAVPLPDSYKGGTE